MWRVANFYIVYIAIIVLGVDFDGHLVFILRAESDELLVGFADWVKSALQRCRAWALTRLWWCTIIVKIIETIFAIEALVPGLWCWWQLDSAEIHWRSTNIILIVVVFGKAFLDRRHGLVLLFLLFVTPFYLTDRLQFLLLYGCKLWFRHHVDILIDGLASTLTTLLLLLLLLLFLAPLLSIELWECLSLRFSILRVHVVLGVSAYIAWRTLFVLSLLDAIQRWSTGSVAECQWSTSGSHRTCRPTSSPTGSSQG